MRKSQMPEIRENELPYIISLANDSSEKVKRGVAKALIAYKGDLRNKIKELPISLDKDETKALYQLIKDYIEDKDDYKSFSKFLPGTVVVHKVYGYRGVVVDVDLFCMADDEWIEANSKTKPELNQPWYHVLVDDSVDTTYAAQGNLELDDLQQEVNHPYIPNFFSKFLMGKYIRNTVPWPAF